MFIAVIFIALVGMAAFVVDVGSWYQADSGSCRPRQTQPRWPACKSSRRAVGGEGDRARIRATQLLPAFDADRDVPHGETIDVAAKADTPGIFAPVINDAFDVVTVHAEAQAQLRAPERLKDVAPIAV